ncbi:cytochrome P450 CYP72A219 isoform X1 [Rosa chinensis]|nr:cytochrome P450 CYP72A219 isoform X1 [Rosa chinensis]XP_040366384.1 cytochrome P450 CYP72A219 isoform X1 [Rosa chinensis]
MQMEVSLGSIAVSVVLLIIASSWAWRVLNWVWLKPKKLENCLRQQGFAGNSYRLLIGDLKENIKVVKDATSKPMNLSDDVAPRVLPYLHQTINKHGKNSFMWFATTPRVTIMNPDYLKDIFTKYDDFQKPHTSPIVKLLSYGLAHLEGEKWVQRRKLINPAFHIEKLKNMLPAFYQSCTDMISNWETKVSKEGSCELDIWPFLQNMSGDVISRTAFGSSYEEGRTIFELQKEQVQLLSKALFIAVIPGLRFLPTELNRRMKAISKEIEATLKHIISKKEEAMKTGDEASKNDLLGILLESNWKEIRQYGGNKNVGMSIEEVIGECKLFYFAGAETTSILLTWTMILLCRYPNWQARAREEVFQVFGNKKPDFDGLVHLKVVTMILYEVLRLYPPVPVMTRTVQKETQLGNLLLPPGVQLSLPIFLVQQDQQLWGEDAKEFNPERFSEGISKATKGQVSFIPFGWGPRICIGQNFGLMEAKMVLSLILRSFTFELSPSYTHGPITAITIQPQYGAHIILQKL